MLGMIPDMLPTFVERLIPADYDRITAATRKKELLAQIEHAGVEVVDMFEAGSFNHGTGVRDHADVDNMVWVRLAQKTQLPSSTLSRFRTALLRLTARRVSVASPAVRIEYWTAPYFEVVPAFINGTKGDVTVYDIPGRRDEWVQSAPKAHNDLVDEQNDRLGKRLKPLVRLLKAWKYHAGAAVSSFYLEMRATEYAKGESVIVYEIDLKRVLRTILSKDVADMNDPSGITGRVPACASDEDQRATSSAMRVALDDLERAEGHRKADDAMSYWISMSHVFGNNYPWPST